MSVSLLFLDYQISVERICPAVTVSFFPTHESADENEIENENEVISLSCAFLYRNNPSEIIIVSGEAIKKTERPKAPDIIDGK